MELAKAWRTDKFLRRLDVCLFSIYAPLLANEGFSLYFMDYCVLQWFSGRVRLLNMH